MNINPLRDNLLSNESNFFRDLVEKIEGMKADFKKKCRRKSPGYENLIGYRTIKKISKFFYTVINKKRINQDETIENLKSAAIELNILARRYSEGISTYLEKVTEDLYRKTISLLPDDCNIQLLLFNAKEYESECEQRPVTKSFKKWLNNCDLFKNRKTKTMRKMYLEALIKNISTAQMSIKFSVASKIAIT